MADNTLIRSTSDGKPQRVWLLAAITGAILLWLGADEMQSRQPLLRQQIEQARKRIERSSPAALEARKAEARQLADERRAILDRLKSDEDEQMTRARLVYELRQKCDEVPIVCRVRLADLSVGLVSARAGGGAASTPGTGASGDVEALGVGRARAVLSGSFKDEELMALYRSFGDDTRYQWRLNAVVVRNNNFELDVERLVLYSRSGDAQEQAK